MPRSYAVFALCPAGSIPGQLSVFASDFVGFIYYIVVVVLSMRVWSDIKGKT